MLIVNKNNFNIENNNGRSSDSIDVTHRVLGIMIIILSFYQIIFGNIIYFIQTSQSLKTGWIHKAKLGHKIGGIMAVLLSLVQLSIGAKISYRY